MADKLRLTRPSFSTEKMLLIPRTTRRGFSIGKHFASRLPTSPHILPTSARLPPNNDSSQLPVHNYSFIAKSSHQLQMTHTASLHYSPARLRRVQSIRMATEGDLDETTSKNKEDRILRDALVIRPLIKPQEESPVGKAKPRSSFLEFIKSRKRSVKTAQPQDHIEGFLLRFLQVRRSRPSPC